MSNAKVRHRRRRRLAKHVRQVLLSAVGEWRRRRAEMRFTREELLDCFSLLDPWPGPVAWNCGECDPDLPCFGQLVHCIRYVPEAP